MTTKRPLSIERFRNVGISAHIDAGKTTLTERMLFYCGRIHQMREVRGNDGGATMDSDPIERRRGITIASAATSVRWSDHHVNIIDTPGHVDFTVEVERALRVLDGAVLVLCSVGGVQSQTLTVSRQLKRYGVPHFALINKMDRVGANPQRVIHQLRERIGSNPVALQLPIGTAESFQGVVDLLNRESVYFAGEHGEVVRRDSVPDGLRVQTEAARAKLIESLAAVDDSILASLLDEVEPSTEQLQAAIRSATASRKILPVLFASAYKNKGVQEVLDAICGYLPHPSEREVFADELDKSGEALRRVRLSADVNSQPVVMAFKTVVEKFGQLTFLRVYQGRLSVSQSLRNTRTGKRVRFGRLVRVHSDQREDIAHADAGDLVAAVGVDCASGDTFVGEGPRLRLENIVVADPVVRLTIEPERHGDRDKLSKSLQRFRRQDPTFHVMSDTDSGETQIAGMGALHLDVYVERLREECDCPCVVGRPSVTYQERPTQSVEFSYRFKKQNGGKGLFAQITGRLDPLPADAEESFVFSDTITGGRVSRPFVTAVRNGVQEALTCGPIDGYQVTGVKFTLIDGEEHEKDSTELAFQLCATEAIRDVVLPQCGAQMFEPMMSLEIEIPSEFQGAVTGHLGQLRGVVTGSQLTSQSCQLTANAPLAELFDYANCLRSMTQGKGCFSMQPSGYRVVPKNASRIMERTSG